LLLNSAAFHFFIYLYFIVTLLLSTDGANLPGQVWCFSCEREKFYGAFTKRTWGGL